MSLRRLYLSGPDVFRPDAAAHGRALVALCAEHGFEGLYPLDEHLPADLPTPHVQADWIYRANLALIDRCDAVLANLDFFRGAEPDSGTCFEVGYAVARGKPVWGYVPEGGSLAERIRRRHPELVGAGGDDDVHGWRLEEFGLPVNLMLGVPCRIVVGDARAALRALRAEQDGEGRS
jgi:nucleoside 2-deoxyribosyltransferase